jgi:hypothetical protein
VTKYLVDIVLNVAINGLITVGQPIDPELIVVDATINSIEEVEDPNTPTYYFLGF